MSKKELFINYIEETIDGFENAPEEVQEFWESFKAGKTVGGMTEKGQQILDFMKEHKEEFNNLFKAKDIGEGLFIGSRSVSGSIRKLVEDGYVEKCPGNPVTYSLIAE